MIDRTQLEAALASAEPHELLAVAGELQGQAFMRLSSNSQGNDYRANDDLLTMPEVAECLSITEHQARELGRRGELPTITVGDRFVRVRRRALEDWIRHRENGLRMSRRGER